MQSFAIVLSLLAKPFRQRRTRLFLWMVLLFVVMVGVYSTVFHVIMESEG